MEEKELLTRALAHRYRIERRIGRGGMATVYLAHDLKHDRRVAVKVLDPELGRSLGAERFLREIKTAANLHHPHILAVFDSGEAGGFLYFVMPFVEGESLLDRLSRERQLPVEDAIRITREIAEALDYANQRGVIHRDVKPANIMLEAGHAILADFGVAQAVSEAKAQRITQTGMSVGTPAYMSPEQATGEQDLDGRSDQYALGCVLYEMLSGDAPYLASTPQAVIAKKLSDPVPRISVVRETVPVSVEEALRKALAKNRVDRFGMAEEFAAALTQRVSHSNSRSRSGRTKAVFFAVTVILGLATVVVVASRWGRGRPGVVGDKVVVLPFDIVGGNDSLDAAGELAAYGIAMALSRTGIVQVVPPEVASSWWKRTEERRTQDPTFLRSIAEDLGAGILVLGSILSATDTIRVTAGWVDAKRFLDNPRSEPVAVPRDSLDKALRVIAEGLAASLGRRFSRGYGEGDFDRYWRPPGSLEAWKEHELSRDAFVSREFESWLRHAENALVIDSTFLAARTSQAVALLNLERFAEADSVLGELERSRAEMGPGELAHLEWARGTLRGNREQAYLAMKAGAVANPFFRWAWGFEALRMNRPQEALDVLSGMDLSNPLMEREAGYWESLGEALHRLDEHRRELREVRRGRRRYPDNPWVLQAEVRAQAALGHVKEVNTLLDEAIENGRQTVYSFRVAVLELRAHEYHEASLAVGERALAYLREHPSPAAEAASWRYELLRFLYLLERWDEAEPLAETLVRGDSTNLSYLGYLGTLAAWKGERAEAERIGQELANLDRPYLLGSNTFWRARIAAVLGEKDQAVLLLRQAHQEGEPFDIGIHTDPALQSLRGYPPFEQFMRPRG